MKGEDQLEGADNRMQPHGLNAGIGDLIAANGKSHINPGRPALKWPFKISDSWTPIERRGLADARHAADETIAARRPSKSAYHPPRLRIRLGMKPSPHFWGDVPAGRGEMVASG